MNRTQKEAWTVVFISILYSLLLIIMAFTTKSLTQPLLPGVLIVLILITMASLFVFLRRKQSPKEVNYDERDVAIKRKALLASHTALWTLIFLGCVAPLAITGQWETFPVGLLPIAIFILAIADMLVYSLTILIQYGRSGDGNK
jgi:hypothetical protein